MKKIVLIILTLVVIIVAFAGWKFFGPTIHVPGEKYFFVSTGATYKGLKEGLIGQDIISGERWFDWAARIVSFKTVEPGRYEIKKGMSLVGLVRMLKNGSQTPVNLVITKLRTKESLASRVGNSFEFDSTQMILFLNSRDSLKEYGLDDETVMAAVMPFTYRIKWNTTPRRIFDQFYAAYKTFWTAERKKKAGSLGLNPVQVSTLASIIDEETNASTDKPNIASVYLNRLSKGMPLQADPTLKFALKNFALKRILNEHKNVQSPYNTYAVKGLPPGPICTPALETIDAVLDSPKTDYLYFVANSNFDGTHIFTNNYSEHMKYARIYQQELNKRNIQ